MVVVVNIMLGLITPPYGLLLFIMTRISGSPMKAIIGDVLPFLWLLIGALVGAVMKATRGQADAAAVKAILLERLGVSE